MCSVCYSSNTKDQKGVRFFGATIELKRKTSLKLLRNPDSQKIDQSGLSETNN